MGTQRLRGRLTRIGALMIGLAVALVGVGGASGATDFANDAFRAQWQGTDAPVAGGMVSRAWVWGPGPNTARLTEPYAEAAAGQRDVQYFDKSRMELGASNAVTNGLLTTELISGQLQTGNNTFEARQPARIPVAGDPENVFPTYADLAKLRVGPEPRNTGTAQAVTKIFAPDGSFGRRDAAVNDPLAATTGYDDATGHNLPRAFADFRTNPTSGGLPAIGYALTEPVWASVRVGGTPKQVLLQAFERRVLTYTPGNSPGFEVEAGNVGQHYYRWRYMSAGATSSPAVTATTTPTPTAAASTDTPATTATATGAATAATTPTARATP